MFLPNKLILDKATAAMDWETGKPNLMDSHSAIELLT